MDTPNYQFILSLAFYNPSFVYIPAVLRLNSLNGWDTQFGPPLLNNFSSSAINSCRINTKLLFRLKNRISLQEASYLSLSQWYCIPSSLQDSPRKGSDLPIGRCKAQAFLCQNPLRQSFFLDYREPLLRYVSFLYRNVAIYTVLKCGSWYSKF